VAGGDLERARSEVGLDALVGDDRHATLDEGHDHLFADEVAIALVVRARLRRRRRNRRRRTVAIAM